MIGWMNVTQPSASPIGSSLVKRSMCILLWRINTRVFSAPREAQVSTGMISTTGAKREPSGIFCVFKKSPQVLVIGSGKMLSVNQRNDAEKVRFSSSTKKYNCILGIPLIGGLNAN